MLLISFVSPFGRPIKWAPSQLHFYSGSHRQASPKGVGVTTFRNPDETVPGGELSPCWHAFRRFPTSTPGVAGACLTGAEAPGCEVRCAPGSGGAAPAPCGGAPRSIISSIFLLTVLPSHSSVISSLLTATRVNDP